MNCTTEGHEAWFRDVRTVHITAEHARGCLPLPFTGPDHAAFYYINVARPEDTRDMLDKAVRIFRDAYRDTYPLRFGDRYTQTGSTRRYHVEAMLPSGLTLTLTAKAEHMDGFELPALREQDERKLVAA